MQAFTVELTGDRTERIAADAYQQEGPLTTFFTMGSDRTVIDSWSQRVASFRTADLIAVRSTRLAEELVAA